MFSTKLRAGLFMMLAFALALAGCAKPTEDPAVRITQIAATVQYQLTQSALLTPSPTATYTPTATATPQPPTPTLNVTVTPPTLTATRPVSNSGDNATYVADVTIPDGTVMTAGTKFTKTWTVKNSGTTTWTKEYQLIYLDGIMGTNNLQAVKLTQDVAPGATIDISVDFTAPQTNGPYVSYWKMYNAAGYVFGDALNLQFSVGSATSTSAPQASATETATFTSTPGTTTTPGTTP